jgi:phage shock protein C
MEKKRLYKSKTDKFITGVCGGLAEYFDVDPTLVRIAAALLCTTGYGFLVYIVAAVVMPEKEE